MTHGKRAKPRALAPGLRHACGMAGEDAIAAQLAAGLKAFGKPAFRPGQEEAVRAALAKRDSLIVLPTGGGKSLCFLMSARLQPGAPLRRALAFPPAHRSAHSASPQGCAWSCRRCAR